MSDAKKLVRIYNDNVKDYGGPHLEMREADFVEAVEAWNTRANPWIEINKDNLPDGYVLAYNGITKRYGTLIYALDKLEEVICSDGRGHLPHVTHYMIIPEITNANS